MIRFFKRLLSLLLLLCILAGLGCFFVLPRLFPLGYSEYVEKYAAKYQLDSSLVYAMIYCESKFDAEAVSSANAKGLMQVTEDTGNWVASTLEGMDAAEVDLFDAETNIRIGCRYLQWLLEKFDGYLETSLAGYNAGHGNVARWLSDEEKSKDGITLEEIPYAETEKYVQKVKRIQKIYEWIYRI